jgi:hypothetical protein
MKRITRFLCRCVAHTDGRTLVSIGLCVGYLVVVAAVLVLLNVGTGCATTPAGLSREQALYQAGTNVVGRRSCQLPPRGRWQEKLFGPGS